MIAALRAELVKLRRRGLVVGVLVATVVLCILGAAVTVLGDGGGGGGPFGGGGTGAVSPTSAASVVDGVVAVAGLLGAVVMVVAVLSVADEYSHGTLQNVLLRHPDRPRLLAGKLLGVGLVALLLALTATIVGLGAMVVVGGVDGLDTSAWRSIDGLVAAAGVAGGLAASNLTAAAIGATAAVAFRAAAPAIGLGLGWLLVGEQAVGALLSVEAGLPGQLAAALVDGDPSTDLLLTGTLLALWLIALGTVTLATFTRRDVVV